MSFENISVEGGILAPDFLDKISERGKQTAPDFGLPAGTSVLDAASAAWGEARALRVAFQSRQKRLEASGKSESPDTATRERWMKPWFDILGYDLTFNKKHLEADGRTYPISHRDGWLPVHIIGNDQTLDEKHGRYSAHAAVQDYLNRSEALWGIVTNGEELRLLRNSVQFTRQAFVQVDLGDLLDGDRFDEFLTLYRLIHRTRFAAGGDPTKSSDSLIEAYHTESIEESGRLRDRLRDSVEDAILRLGNGFLQHPHNEALRADVAEGTLAPQELYREILYLVYRLLFLLVAEERHLIGAARSAIYASFGLARLRDIAAARHAARAAHEDYYLQLRSLFYILDDEKAAKAAGLPCLNGDLFAPRRIDELSLDNRTLLQVVWRLAYFRDDSGIVRSVNYAALNVEELGSVYESLLDFAPLFETGKTVPGFALGMGMERKSTGSHYTHPDLVAETLKHSLTPVIEERLKNAGDDAAAQKQALLSIRVIDPAAGSGHFLLAAARILGKRLAHVQTGNEEPDPKSLRRAIRSVISHCIYGVDKNPLAVDLCKVALWIEGYSEGMPLSFLDHRIRCGDSLVGVFDLSVIDPASDSFGIPDGAYKPVSGDDKKVAASMARQNKAEREAATARGLFALERLTHSFVQVSKAIDTTEDTSIASIRKKSRQYAELHAKETDWWKEATLCHLWTAAFFAELSDKAQKKSLIPTTGQMKDFAADRLPETVVQAVWETAARLRFFHWRLEFPEVFADGGFDVVVGNPPWDVVEAPSPYEQPPIERYQKWIAGADRFRFNEGRFNLFVGFLDFAQIVSRDTVGMVVPTSLATNKSTAGFSEYLLRNGHLESLYDFENRRPDGTRWFAGLHPQARFCVVSLRTRHPGKTRFGFLVPNIGYLQNDMFTFEADHQELMEVSPSTFLVPAFRSRSEWAIYRKLIESAESLASLIREFWLGLFFNFDRASAEAKTGVPGHGSRSAAAVYEIEYIQQFDHRFSTYSAAAERAVHCTPTQHQDAMFRVVTGDTAKHRYVRERWNAVVQREPRWSIALRRQTQATNAYTCIAAIIPGGVAVEGSLLCLSPYTDRTADSAILLGAINCLPWNFATRTRISGANLNKTTIEQIPLMPRDAIGLCRGLLPRILELTYTAWDIKAFADDVWKEADAELRMLLKEQHAANKQVTGGHKWDPPEWAEIDPDGIKLPPFKWDEDRRAVLRAELDAYYARLYGLSLDDLRYILDPKDVYGEDFPGETFRVLKDKEMREFGEYRTKRLVLEAWGRL